MTVFKRALEVNYNLKMKNSRALLGEVGRRHSVYPFSLRGLVPYVEKGETGARMGVQEPLQHNMLHSYPVMWEKEGAEVAHVKVTALMLPGGTMKATGKDLPDYVRSEKKREWRLSGSAVAFGAADTSAGMQSTIPRICGQSPAPNSNAPHPDIASTLPYPHLQCPRTWPRCWPPRATWARRPRRRRRRRLRRLPRARTSR